MSADLEAVIDALREEVADESDALVYVSSLNGNATVTIRAAARDEDVAHVWAVLTAATVGGSR